MIYITGDTHGDFSRIERFCDRFHPSKDDVMIILGDAGFNYYGGKRDQRAKKRMAEMPITIFSIHGNHEMRPGTIPSYRLRKWNGGMVFVEDEYPNLLFAVDGEVFDIRRWYRNGGDITHARLLRCSKAYRQEMLDIIQTLPVNLEIRCGGTDYLLVHGGPLGYRHRYDDPVRDSVWMRLDETTALPEGKTVIFGHTPTCHYQSDTPMRIYHAADGLYAQNAG